MVAEDLPPSFLSAADEALLEEDEEQNKRQAIRNRRIRGLLAEKKRNAPIPERKPLGFDEEESTGQKAVAAVSPAAVEAEATEEGPPPWYSLNDEPSVNLRLHEELLDFANFMRPSPPEMAAREAWAARIGDAARETLGESCEVHLFGSSSTGLNLPSADIDVTVAGVQGTSPTTAMKRIANWLLEKGEVSKVEIVQSARVPVTKLQQRSTGLWADVIINRMDGLETSKFIRDHVELFPALSPLVLFLKLFLLQRGLGDTFGGGLGSYLLVCLVLSFLQRHPSARNVRAHERTTLGNLLFDFFRHYGQEFRYGQAGISLLNGGSLFDRAKRGFDATTRTGQATLCVESPTESGVDMGARCFKIGVVRASFNHAYHCLSKAFLERQGPGASLLCPMLVSAKHDVVKNRYQLFKEQQNPLLDLAPIPEDIDEEEEQFAKRRKLEALGGGVAASPGQAAPAQPNAPPPAVDEADEAERARLHFEMMMAPVDGEVPPMESAVYAAPGDGMMEVDQAELQMLEELTAEDQALLEEEHDAIAVTEVPQAVVPLVADVPAVAAEVCVCGEILLPDAKFCSECGAKVQHIPAVNAPVAPELPPPVVEATTVSTIVAADEDDLDEVGIFLQAMQEVEATSRRSPSVASPLVAEEEVVDAPLPVGLVPLPVALPGEEVVVEEPVSMSPVEEVIMPELGLEEDEDLDLGEDVAVTEELGFVVAEEVAVTEDTAAGDDFIAF